MDIRSPDSSEVDKEEATPTATEEVLPDTPREQTPSMIVICVLDALYPRWKSWNQVKQ